MSQRSVEHASFTIERRYDAPPHRVFAAWADPAAKDRWFARAEGWEVAPHELDFREGGLEVGRSRMPGGPLHTYRAIFWEVIADHRIVYTYEMLIDDARISVSLVTVELSPDAGGTQLALTEHGAFFDGLEDPDRRRDGTGSLLEALARELSAQA
jgi:uncharacterized protein YndB with AHSA1/START domain